MHGLSGLTSARPPLDRVRSSSPAVVLPALLFTLSPPSRATSAACWHRPGAESFVAGLGELRLPQGTPRTGASPRPECLLSLEGRAR